MRGSDMEARSEMMLAALFGGVAEVLAYLHRLGYRLKGLDAAAGAGTKEAAAAGART